MYAVAAFSVFSLFAVDGSAQCDDQNNYPLTDDVHGDYTLSLMRPNSFQPQVTGLETLPNGDLLVQTWRGQSGPSVVPEPDMYKTGNRDRKGELWRVSNTSGPASQMTAKKVTTAQTDFKDAQGIVRVGEDIYVGDIDKVYKMVDADGDGVYEARTTIATLPSYDGWFEYAFGPVHKDGFLYMALAVNVHMSGNWVKQWGPNRSTVVKIPIAGGTPEPIVSGLRAPDGIGIGPDGEVFVTDNQGGYRPTSPLIHVKEGRFYGYRMEAGMAPFIDKPITKPTLWMPYREINDSPTEPALMTTGIYKNQMFYGDIGRGGLYRAFLEKVLDPKTGEEEYQGAVFLFSSGFEAAVHRIRTTEDGALILGELGNGGASNQGWRCRKFGLQKLTPKANPSVFEILAVRARKGGLELEFTQPLGQNVQASHFTARQWTYAYQQGYGAGMGTRENLSVSSVRVSEDRTRVFLAIGSMKDDGHVVHIKVGSGLKSENGASLKPLWDETWYTVRAFSETEPFSDVVGIARQGALERVRASDWNLRRLGDGWAVIWPGTDERAFRILSLDGKVLATGKAHGGQAFALPETGKGLRLLESEGRVLALQP